jgi:hypothetical protein
MKGQISIEYIIALILFIVFVLFFFVQLLNQQPIYMRELRSEIVRSEAYQLSEMLINDAGYPIDWTIANVQRIGLSSNLNKTNFLSKSKISSIGTSCNGGYTFIKNKIGAEDDFSLVIWQLPRQASDNPLLSCFPSQIALRDINITIRRPVAFEGGGYGELVLQMW